MWRRIGLAFIALLVPLAVSCQASEIDALEKQVHDLRSANESLESRLSDQQDRIDALTLDVDDAMAANERLDFCLKMAMSAAGSLAQATAQLGKPDLVPSCCTYFSPQGKCADTQYRTSMVFMQRQQEKAYRFLFQVMKQRTRDRGLDS
jgi:hypothetical protein